MGDALDENGKVEVLAPLPNSWEDGTRLSVEEAGPSPSVIETFRALVEEWKRETRYRSFSPQIALHPAYQRIIGMGLDGLSLILRELQTAPHHWFKGVEHSGVEPLTSSMPLKRSTS